MSVDDPNFDERQQAILARLESLRTEHRDLDDVIARLSENAPFNQLQIQRLKKRKLVLKDQMIALENQLIPDIIA
ncbi:YdcH family protein [Rhodovibrionaceae bacterium A322]